MPSPVSRSHVEFDLGQQSERREVPDSGERFRILICGDFSGGRNGRLESPLSGRMPVLVDRDNIERVMRHLRPQLHLAGLDLSFGEIDDFHPDQIYQRTPGFESLVNAAARAAPCR